MCGHQWGRFHFQLLSHVRGSMKYFRHAAMMAVKEHAADLKLLVADLYAQFQDAFVYQDTSGMQMEIVFRLQRVVSKIRDS